MRRNDLRSIPALNTGSTPPAGASTGSRLGRWLPALLVLLGALAFGTHLASPGYFASDELFYMAGAISMRESGDWLVPVYDGEPRLKKPPLQYWLVAVSYELFGVGLAQARLPSALAAAGCVALLYGLGLQLFGRTRAGLYGMCALLSSSLFLRQAHVAITDSVLALFVLAAWFGLACARSGRRGGAVLAWVAMALAALQKGPVGVLIPLLTLIVWMAWQGRREGLAWRTFFPPSGMLIFWVLVLPWPLLVLHRLGWAGFTDPVQSEVGLHVSASLSHTVSAGGHYLVDLIRSIWPWSFLLVLCRRPHVQGSAFRFLAVAVGLVVLVYSVGVLKERWRYMIPAVPALALLCGHVLATLEQSGEHARVRRVLYWGSLAWLVWAVAVAGGQGLAARTSAPATAMVLFVVAGVALVGGGAALRGLRRAPDFLPWALAMAATLPVVNTALAFSPRALGPPHAMYALAREHVEGIPPTAVAVVDVKGHPGSLAWMAVRHALPACEPQQVDPTRARVLLTTAAAWGDVPPETRALYRFLAARVQVESRRPTYRGPELCVYLVLARIGPVLGLEPARMGPAPRPTTRRPRDRSL